MSITVEQLRSFARSDLIFWALDQWKQLKNDPLYSIDEFYIHRIHEDNPNTIHSNFSGVVARYFKPELLFSYNPKNLYYKGSFVDIIYRLQNYRYGNIRYSFHVEDHIFKKQKIDPFYPMLTDIDTDKFVEEMTELGNYIKSKGF